jgi:hypothetical protein
VRDVILIRLGFIISLQGSYKPPVIDNMYILISLLFTKYHREQWISWYKTGANKVKEFLFYVMCCSLLYLMNHNDKVDVR